MDQGLPTNFENTASTWQNMPAMAAFYTGQQNRLAEENVSALQRAFEAEQVYKAQERPVTLQNLVNSGELTHAQALNQNALARHTGLGSDLLAGTLQGDIASKNAKSSSEIVGADVAKGEGEAQLYGQLAGQLKNLPANTPSFVKAQIVMDKLRIQDPTGQVAQHLAANADQLPGLLQGHADYVYKNSTAARAEANKEAAAQKRVETQGTTQREVAKEATTRATEVARITHNVDFELAKAEMSKDPSQQAAAYEKKAQLEAQISKSTDPNDPTRGEHLQLANFYVQKAEAAKQQALALKSAAAGATKPGTLDLPGTTNLPAAAATNVSPSPTVRPPGIGAPVQAPIKTQPLTAPPSAAIAYLMAHPEAAAQFEAKYGPGTAQAILKGK